uniref:Uncharacterized protein n=1 Tax=Proboscia inermis TaxID=420281 RepID=A0A7S0CL97_9STRA|mmetsp:Transcript_7779/g.7967  ORF Transcript_7779/g.7967 Transcript_7779/m.7967 type:complete len:110 (+) Transcript_7779:103-432(+)
MIAQVKVSIVITFLLQKAPLIISGPDGDKDDVKDDDTKSKKFNDIDDKGDADDDDVLPEQQTPLELPESQPTPQAPNIPVQPTSLDNSDENTPFDPTFEHLVEYMYRER